MLELQDLFNYLYWLIDIVGYTNFIIVLIIIYIAYYLLSNTLMFVMFIGIGIAIGVYLSYAMRRMM